MPDVLVPGTRAVHRVFSHFTGVVEEAPQRGDGIYVLRLDPDIGHFRDTIFVQANEIAEERAYAIEEAQRDLDYALGRRESTRERVRWARREDDKAAKEVTEARKQLRVAQKAAALAGKEHDA